MRLPDQASHSDERLPQWPACFAAKTLSKLPAMVEAALASRRARRTNAQIADKRRRDLLEAAFSVIADKGLEGLRTRDVAARAGVNIATLHYYFETKEDLIVAVVRHVRELFIEVSESDATQGTDDPLQSLRSHIASAGRRFYKNPHLLTVLLELTLRARRDPIARRALRSIQSRWNRLVEDILRDGLAAGRLRQDLDPRAGAALITSYIIGARTQSGIRPQSFDFAAVSRELERWVAAKSS